MILQGKRVLITQANDFMGPTLCEVFGEQGAEVIANPHDLSHPDSAASVVTSAGAVDVLVANLSIPAPTTPAPTIYPTSTCRPTSTPASTATPGG